MTRSAKQWVAALRRVAELTRKAGSENSNGEPERGHTGHTPPPGGVARPVSSSLFNPVPSPKKKQGDAIDPNQVGPVVDVSAP